MTTNFQYSIPGDTMVWKLGMVAIMAAVPALFLILGLGYLQHMAQGVPMHGPLVLSFGAVMFVLAIIALVAVTTLWRRVRLLRYLTEYGVLMTADVSDVVILRGRYGKIVGASLYLHYTYQGEKLRIRKRTTTAGVLGRAYHLEQLPIVIDPRNPARVALALAGHLANSLSIHTAWLNWRFLGIGMAEIRLDA